MSFVVFVGDAPSKKNKDPKSAFVGTKSYDKLCTWIPKLDISINNVYICNREHITARGTWFDVSTPEIALELGVTPYEQDKVIALGDKASKYLTQIGCEHFKLPHPSGRNLKLNDEKLVRNVLKQCKEFIHG